MICRICNEEKELDDFPWKNKAAGKKNETCKACQREYGRQHYRDNKQKYKDTANKNRPEYVERNREFLLSYLSEHPCVDCGETDMIVLEFDHREPLRCRGKRVGNYMGSSLERLQEEIDKCDVVCANCHTRRTARMMNWKRLDYF